MWKSPTRITLKLSQQSLFHQPSQWHRRPNQQITRVTPLGREKKIRIDHWFSLSQETLSQVNSGKDVPLILREYREIADEIDRKRPRTSAKRKSPQLLTPQEVVSNNWTIRLQGSTNQRPLRSLRVPLLPNLLLHALSHRLTWNPDPRIQELQVPLPQPTSLDFDQDYLRIPQWKRRNYLYRNLGR